MRNVLLATFVLAACQAQGDYTRESNQRARNSLNALHAGTDYDQAMRQLASGDLDHALKTVDSCIARIPDVEKSHLLRARILIERGELNAALAALDYKDTLGGPEPDSEDGDEAEAQSEAEPEEANSEFPYLRGIVHEQRGDLAAAILEYQAAHELAPGRPEVTLALAEVLVSLERIDEARAVLDVEIGEFANHAGFRQELGHIALLEMDLDRAEVYFIEAAILSSGDRGILEDLVRVQIARAKYAEALLTFRQLEPLDERADLGRLQAYCFVQTRRPVEARAVLTKLTSDPEGARDFESWKLLADTALMLEDDRLLRSAADRMLQAGPARYEGFVTLAVWKRRTGDLDGALLTARQAMDRAGEDPTPKHLEQLLLRDLALAQE